MIEMEQIKARCWNVPQFFREQKDVWTEKQGYYSAGKVRDRFTISDKVDVVEKWRANGRKGKCPIIETQKSEQKSHRNNMWSHDGINAKLGKAILWIAAVTMLTLILSDVMGLVITKAELQQINNKIVQIRQESDKIENELSQKLGTFYTSQTTQPYYDSAPQTTLLLYVPDNATLPIEIAESEISRERLAVIYGD